MNINKNYLVQKPINQLKNLSIKLWNLNFEQNYHKRLQKALLKLNSIKIPFLA